MLKNESSDASNKNPVLLFKGKEKGKKVKNLLQKWNQISLVKQIIIGLVIGIILALTLPEQLSWITIFGDLFVNALKGVAPVLVFFLVMAAISQHKMGQKTNMKSVIILYLLGTFLAGTLAVITSFIFKLELILPEGGGDVTPPEGIEQVLETLIFNIVDNPVSALMNANYIGILAWAILLGIALRHGSDGTKKILADISDAISMVVKMGDPFCASRRDGTGIQFHRFRRAGNFVELWKTDSPAGRNHAL